MGNESEKGVMALVHVKHTPLKVAATARGPSCSDSIAFKLATALSRVSPAEKSTVNAHTRWN
jgi:hypothetical protein